MLHPDRVRLLADKALAKGATRKSLTTIVWDISNGCPDPFTTVVWGRPHHADKHTKHVIIGPGRTIPHWVEIQTPCRKCEHCLERRSTLWAARARAEFQQSPRTWMGTLTLRPEAWVHAVSTCRAAIANQGLDYDKLAETDRYALIHAQVSKQITLMIKRWRKKKLLLRYLVVLELHKSGVIHYHMLVHEIDADKPVRHRQLCDEWPLGFSKWKLADNSHPWYVAKYLTKSLLARVRASQRYGGELPSQRKVGSLTSRTDREKLTSPLLSALAGGQGTQSPPESKGN